MWREMSQNRCNMIVFKGVLWVKMEKYGKWKRIKLGLFLILNSLTARQNNIILRGLEFSAWILFYCWEALLRASQCLLLSWFRRLFIVFTLVVDIVYCQAKTLVLTVFWASFCGFALLSDKWLIAGWSACFRSFSRHYTTFTSAMKRCTFHKENACFYTVLSAISPLLPWQWKGVLFARKRLILRGFRCFLGVLALCVVKHLHNREIVLFYVLLRAFARFSVLFWCFNTLCCETFA